jgi:hypothetical protein
MLDAAAQRRSNTLPSRTRYAQVKRLIGPLFAPGFKFLSDFVALLGMLLSMYFY